MNQASKSQVTLAKEIMINLRLLIISVVIGMVSYIILYFLLEPGENPLNSVYAQGRAFINLENASESVRNTFLTDIQEKAISSFFYAAIILISFRYLNQGYKWVKKTSKM